MKATPAEIEKYLGVISEIPGQILFGKFKLYCGKNKTGDTIEP